MNSLKLPHKRRDSFSIVLIGVRLAQLTLRFIVFLQIDSTLTEKVVITVDPHVKSINTFQFRVSLQFSASTCFFEFSLSTVQLFSLALAFLTLLCERREEKEKNERTLKKL
jgi:hypothetical protein